MAMAAIMITQCLVTKVLSPRGRPAENRRGRLLGYLRGNWGLWH